jgi:creatinine amidohydrolase
VSGGRARALGDLTYPEVEALLAGKGTRVALVPSGSTEAHGPHLPLATDSLISESVARRAAELLAQEGLEAVWLPTLHYAVTDWAASFSGTVTIPRPIASGLVLEACVAVHDMGFERVALVNSHLEPDNIDTLREVAKSYEARTGTPLIFADQTRRRWAEKLTDEFRSGSCHAGQYETSLVMAIRPDLVREDLARGLPGLHVPLHEKIRDGARNFADCGMERAYCGTPAGATAAEGHETLEALARSSADAVLQSLK